jgi:hypothetical protein
VISRDSVGGAWSKPVTITDISPNLCWLRDSKHVALASGNTISIFALDGTRTFTLSDATLGLQSVQRAEASPDGRDLYFQGTAVTGESAIYALPLAGGKPRIVVRLDDPDRQL